MRLNSFRGKARVGSRIKIRQSGFGNKRVSMSIPRGMKANIKVKRI